jgi:hypothetical protein
MYIYKIVTELQISVVAEFAQHREEGGSDMLKK